MSGRRHLVRFGSSEEYGLQRVALGAGAGLSVAGVVLCAVRAGAPGSPLLGITAAVLAGAALCEREEVQTLVWMALVGGWALLVPGPFSWWCWPAAVLAVTAHTIGAVSRGTPRTLAWPRRLLVRYAGRLAVVAALTGLATVAGWGLERARLGGSVLLATLALLAVSGWLWAGRRLGGADDPT